MSLKSLIVEAESQAWDPNSKEAWHLELEKEPVNNEKWSCIVTAAIPSEIQDQECIQIYNQCVATGFRKAIRILTMPDVIKLLKENSSLKNSNNKVKTSKTNLRNAKNKKEKITKTEEEGNGDKITSKIKPPAPLFPQILDLAAKYATFTDVDCKLPPDLMAAVLKYMILILKDESCLRKRIDIVKERKDRERNLKEKFIRDLKPYEMSREKTEIQCSSIDNFLNLKEPINDAPVDGPDLYILLVDFYDLYIFPELEKIKVPFMSILKISVSGCPGLGTESNIISQKSDASARKKPLIELFWNRYNEECSSSEKVVNFKNIAVLEYQLNSNPTEIKTSIYRIIFDELSWLQYSVYCIYRQHQKYLQELYVQRLIQSLEPLDLSKCMVYNKLSDALITGEPLTPLLVLYAIVEQVVAGVPETRSMVLEYQPKPTDFFSDGSEFQKSPKKEKKQMFKYITPCFKCRDKKYENICDKLKEDTVNNDSSENEEWSPIYGEYYEPVSSSDNQNNQKINVSEEDNNSVSTTYIISESIIDQAISGKRSEKDTIKEKKWKTPSLGFYGDSVFLQTYHCDPRILDIENLVDRFLRNTDLPKLLIKHSDIPPGGRAFYNFHFNFLKNVSQQSEDVLKLNIFFAMSMKLTGIAKSYLYRGEEESHSDIWYGWKDKVHKSSKMKYNKEILEESNFSSYFYKTFIHKACFADLKENLENLNSIIDSQLLQKVKSQFDIFSTSLCDCGKINTSPLHLWLLRRLENARSNSLISFENCNIELMTLFSLLDCSEISNLTHPNFVHDKEEFLNLINKFKFYEKLEPHVMIQTLFEAQGSFNTNQSSYFPLTNTLMLIMYNESDHNGIFCTTDSPALPTPVTFKDFYSHVYQDINKWLVEELEEYKKFECQLQEKAKIEREKKDSEYLKRLKRYYCQMSEEEKQIFLETDLEIFSESDITEKDLGSLPIKPKPPFPNKLSFVTTNLMDLSVQVTNQIREFHSQDGTEVNVKTETWLYTSSVLRIRVKRSDLLLYYYHCLEEEEIETSFTLKTSSDIIFSFYKNDSEEENSFNYNVTISWPTGLLIQPISLSDSFTYIKQSYLKSYRTGWDIEEETSRCFLKNGQVVIFKEYGGYEILCPSGTKYTFFDLISTPKYELTATTGEIWEVQTKGRCKNKKNLLAVMRIFIGVDPSNQETFYKRDDGVYCMLWPNGRLVTTYPDGTKITTIPDFDENEVVVDFSEEEIQSFKVSESKLKSQQSIENRSRSIIKNSTTASERQSCDNDKENGDYKNFVSISCSYLMEHPKYSSVYFNPEEDNIRVSLPEDLSIFIYPNGNYTIQKERNFLKLCESTLEFYKDCQDCQNRSIVTFNFDENEIFCKCVDFFNKVFIVHRDGNTEFQESCETFGEDEMPDDKIAQKSPSATEGCATDHHKNSGFKQRCFAIERDFSGVEFLHEDLLAFYCDKLPKDTFFQINTDDPSNLSHTFLSPYYKIGYENWVMDYEDEDNSLPTNLKKKDLREMGLKEVTKNLFKYPFPSNHNCGEQRQTEKPKENIDMPKVIMARTIRSWPQDPNLVLNELQKHITEYQRKAHDIWNDYENHKMVEYESHDSRYQKMKLRKIALTLSQSLRMYPHLCTQFPSTEKDIHYFGHFINSMAELKSHFRNLDFIPDCKQIPVPLPRLYGFPSIYEEESESPKSSSC